MAHNRSYKPEDIRFPDQVITTSNLVEEMEKSYIEYAMSVIVGRALPDVRDGLKPVHRRITLDDARLADEIFTILMGEQVEPRKEWIETNAKYAINIDI